MRKLIRKLLTTKKPSQNLGQDSGSSADVPHATRPRLHGLQLHKEVRMPKETFGICISASCQEQPPTVLGDGLCYSCYCKTVG